MTVSANKRLREQRRRDQQRDKAERKRQRKEDAATQKPGATAADPNEDPDIAGIVPGPQAPPEEFG